MDFSELTENDRRELEMFFDYCRRISAAEAAGVPGDEAARSIYPDVYGEEIPATTIVTPQA